MRTDYRVLLDAAAALGVPTSTLQSWPNDVLVRRLMEGLLVAEGKREVADRHIDALMTLLARAKRGLEVGA